MDRPERRRKIQLPTEGSTFVLTKYIPEQLMTSYVRAAMKRVAPPLDAPLGK